MPLDHSLPRLDLVRLASFVVLAQERQFARAAKRLFIAQPTLTARIAGLERALGVPLIDRRVSEFRLTDAGERLALHGSLLLEFEESVVAVVIEERVAAEVRLGATAVTDPALLAAAAHRFLRHRSETQLITSVGTREHLEAEVAASRIDVAVLHRRPVALSGGLVAHHLRDETLVMIGMPASSHLAVPADLVDIVETLIGRRALKIEPMPSEREVLQRVELAGALGHTAQAEPIAGVVTGGVIERTNVVSRAAFEKLGTAPVVALTRIGDDSALGRLVAALEASS